MTSPHVFGNALLDDNGQAQICAVGLWVDMSARLLLLPSLQIMLTESLGGGKTFYKCIASYDKHSNCLLFLDIIPRSIMLNKFDDEIYLLVAMGDGTLVYYLVNTTTCK